MCDVPIPVPRTAILCVDDDPIPLTLRKLALEKAGYEVTIATSGKEALRLAETHKFDLLLSDYLMPEMNGAELAAKMREQYPDIPCFLYSGIAELPTDLTTVNKFFSKLDGIETIIVKSKQTSAK